MTVDPKALRALAEIVLDAESAPDSLDATRLAHAVRALLDERERVPPEDAELLALVEFAEATHAGMLSPGQDAARGRLLQHDLAAGIRSLWARLALAEKDRDAARALNTRQIEMVEAEWRLSAEVDQRCADALGQLASERRHFACRTEALTAELAEIRLRVPTVDVMGVIDQWRPIVEAVRQMAHDDTPGRTTVTAPSGAGWSLHDYAKSVVLPPKGSLL